MLTSEQIRAARSLLRWTAQDLAEFSGVSGRTIQRLEAATGVPGGHTKNLDSVRRALERAGVVFIDQTEESGPGVKLKDPL